MERSETAVGFEGQFQNGSGWFSYPTTRFKTITLQCFWLMPLELPAATARALIPELLKQGCRRWPSARQMAERLEELYGAQFRADVGKVADQQLVSFQIQVVDGAYLPGHPDTFQEAVDFLSEVIMHPHAEGAAFPASVVEVEKALLARRIQALINDKAQYAMTRLLEEVADGRPFGLPKLGRLDDIDGLDGAALWQRYQRLRDEASLVVVAVGNVDSAKVEAAARTLAGDGRRGALSTITAYQPAHHGHVVVERQEVRQGKVNSAYATGCTLKDPRFPALLMFSGILGGFPHSKLFMNVREKASLAYYAYARPDANLGLMTIGAGIEFANFDAVRGIIDEQIEAMCRGDFTDQEWQFTLEAYRNELRSEEDAPGQLIGRQLERLLAGGGLLGPELMEAMGRVRREEVVAMGKDLVWDTTYFLTQKDAPEEGQR